MSIDFDVSIRQEMEMFFEEMLEPLQKLEIYEGLLQLYMETGYLPVKQWIKQFKNEYEENISSLLCQKVQEWQESPDSITSFLLNSGSVDEDDECVEQARMCETHLEEIVEIMAKKELEEVQKGSVLKADINKIGEKIEEICKKELNKVEEIVEHVKRKETEMEDEIETYSCVCHLMEIVLTVYKQFYESVKDDIKKDIEEVKTEKKKADDARSEFKEETKRKLTLEDWSKRLRGIR